MNGRAAGGSVVASGACPYQLCMWWWPSRRLSALPVVGCDEPWRLRDLRSTALELMLDKANMSFELGLLKPRYIKFGDCIISRLDTGAAIALTCYVPFTMTSIDVVNLTGDTCIT